MPDYLMPCDALSSGVSASAMQPQHDARMERGPLEEDYQQKAEEEMERELQEHMDDERQGGQEEDDFGDFCLDAEQAEVLYL